MKEVIFHLQDGTPVHKGDILYHPDRVLVGWYCMAQFKPEEDSEFVVVRSPNGAVPMVKIADLKSEPPLPQKRCRTCGQLLPMGVLT